MFRLLSLIDIVVNTAKSITGELGGELYIRIQSCTYGVHVVIFDGTDQSQEYRVSELESISFGEPSFMHLIPVIACDE